MVSWGGPDIRVPVEYGTMTNGRRVRVYKRRLSRYYLREMMPSVLCSAGLMVVLQISEKAEAIYRKMVQSYGLRSLSTGSGNPVLGHE